MLRKRLTIQTVSEFHLRCKASRPRSARI